MPDVSIGEKTYKVYGDTAAADEYLDASTSAGAWRDASADDKARALVSATRWLDALKWQGEKTDEGQILQWPRKGIPDASEDSVPLGVIYASFELAAGLIDDPDLRTSLSDAKVSSLSAGSVSLSFFRGSSVQITTPFPKMVMDYVGQWLAAGANAAKGGIHAGAVSFGTCARNPLQDKYDFNDGI